jgi:hypothetical protein
MTPDDEYLRDIAAAEAMDRQDRMTGKWPSATALRLWIEADHRWHAREYERAYAALAPQGVPEHG